MKPLLVGFHPLDLVVFIFVIVGTWLFGFYQQKLSQQKSKNNWLEWMCMSRKMTLPLFITSLMSTWYGGIFGVTTLAFEKGVYNFITQGLFWYLAYIIFALVIIPKLNYDDGVTLPELVGKKVGSKSKKLVMLLSYFNFIPIAYVLSLALFVQTLTGLDLFWSAVIGLIIGLSYSLIGGLRSLIYTESIQAITMIVAVALVLIFATLKHGSPLELISHLPSSHFDWTGGEKISTILVWGFIAFSTLVDPTFYQRSLALEDKKKAQKGILLTTLVWFGFDCMTTLGAFYARGFYSHFPADQSYLLFGLELLPIGLKGLFIAGIIATILSTLDAYLFSAGTVLAYDLQGRKNFTRLKLAKGMLVTGLICLVVIPFSDGKVVSVWRIMGGFSAACLFLPWTIQLFLKEKLSDDRFSLSILTGMVFLIFAWLSGIDTRLNLDLFYFGAFGSGIICVIHIVRTMFNK